MCRVLSCYTAWVKFARWSQYILKFFLKFVRLVLGLELGLVLVLVFVSRERWLWERIPPHSSSPGYQDWIQHDILTIINVRLVLLQIFIIWNLIIYVFHQPAKWLRLGFVFLSFQIRSIPCCITRMQMTGHVPWPRHLIHSFIHSIIPFNSGSKAHKTTGKSNDIKNTQTWKHRKTDRQAGRRQVRSLLTVGDIDVFV